MKIKPDEADITTGTLLRFTDGIQLGNVGVARAGEGGKVVSGKRLYVKVLIEYGQAKFQQAFVHIKSAERMHPSELTTNQQNAIAVAEMVEDGNDGDDLQFFVYHGANATAMENNDSESKIDDEIFVDADDYDSVGKKKAVGAGGGSATRDTEESQMSPMVRAVMFEPVTRDAVVTPVVNGENKHAKLPPASLVAALDKSADTTRYVMVGGEARAPAQKASRMNTRNFEM